MGFCALFDNDARFGDMKMFGKKFNQSCICLAIMRFCAEVDRVSAVGICGDFFLRSSGFDGNGNSCHSFSITRLADDDGAAARGGVEIFGASFGQGRSSTVGWGWVIENLLASIRIIAGKDDDVEIVWHAVVIFKRVGVAIGEIDNDWIAIFDFGVKLVKRIARDINSVTFAVSRERGWGNPVSGATVSRLFHAKIETSVRVVGLSNAVCKRYIILTAITFIL